MKLSRLFCLSLVAWVFLVSGNAVYPRILAPAPEREEFSFIIAADMRDFTGPAHPGPKYFEGACAAMRQAGPGAFLIATGDIDPPAPLRATLDRFMGTNYPWHPVVGNHDAGSKKAMDWLRQHGATSLPGPLHLGPAGGESTTYSFNHGRAHFIILNQYYDGKTDSASNQGWSNALRSWLEADLETNRQPVVFIAGHVPLKVEPDMDTGKTRHSDSKNPVQVKARDKIIGLLEKHHVTGYLCGHTHNCSVTRQGSFWQLDGGHARGMGSQTSCSSFLKCFVGSRFCWVEVYRDNGAGGSYSLEDRIILTP